MNKTDNTILRSIEGNRLVIDCDKINYKLRMLESNKIPGLMPLEIKESDGKKQLCYDITSGESFESIANTRTLKMEDVRKLIYSLSRILNSIEDYLLIPDDLVLDKKYIYIQGEELEPKLCYLPGYGNDFATGLSNLLQDILGMVDHNDHDAVVLAYSLYQESLKPGYVMSDLLKLLNNEHTWNKEEKQDGKDKKDGREKRDGNEMGDGEYDDANELYEEYDVTLNTEQSKQQSKQSSKKQSKQQEKQQSEKEKLLNIVSKPGRKKKMTLFNL